MVEDYLDVLLGETCRMRLCGFDCGRTKRRRMGLEIESIVVAAAAVAVEL